jgi:hypothetical protein
MLNYCCCCLQGNAAKQATFTANLQRGLTNNGGTTLKHTFDVNLFTQMNVTEGARYLGYRTRGKSAAQAFEVAMM